ncbi:MAG: acyl carrier protein [Ruminococcaceae bacterium]|nr:acyl carrier protein [Oscillospiraceae bacterium]
MRNQVLEILSDIAPSVDFESSNTLADDGLIDSFTIVNIIAELSIEFGVSVPFEEISNENFNSLDSITALVQRLMNE